MSDGGKLGFIAHSQRKKERFAHLAGPAATGIAAPAPATAPRLLLLLPLLLPQHASLACRRAKKTLFWGK